jgi:hypothetical protein
MVELWQLQSFLAPCFLSPEPRADDPMGWHGDAQVLFKFMSGFTITALVNMFNFELGHLSDPQCRFDSEISLRSAE